MNGRRPMKPWEVIATLLTAKQLHVLWDGPQPADGLYHATAVIICPRTKERITLENVRSIQVEHWPERHKHGGAVSPDNAVISLTEGHKEQTRREQKADAKERRLAIARLAKRDVEKRLSKPKWRLKKKLSGAVVKVRVR